METVRLCKACAAPLPLDAPEGLCPKCLAALGIADSDTSLPLEGETMAASGVEAPLPAHPAKLRYLGDYEVLEEIARGGMGVVYKARQVSLNRIVAVKMILSGQLATEAEVKRFRTEAEAAAQLQHPNIVAIHEIGEHEGQHYFSMDYVEGKDLGEIIGERPVEPHRAAELTKIMAEAVNFAHQRGTLHRDLKPQNVLIGGDGQPRIADFGLARQVARDVGLTGTGTIMGSPSYMAPEQAVGRNDRVGPHSDVYSLGAILYAMLTGRPPFQAASPIATLRQVVEDSPKRLTKLNGAVPHDLETICLKCLEKQPERRYPSARTLAEDLGRFLDQEPIHARRPGILRSTLAWMRRHPWALSAVLAMLVLGLMVAVYGLWAQTRYLAWVSEHPDYVRSAGARSEHARHLSQVALVVSLFVFVLGLALSPPEKGQRYETRPFPAAFLAPCGLLGVVTAVFALYVLGVVIEADVWEDISLPDYSFPPWILLCLSLELVGSAVREHRRIYLGLRPE